MSFLFCYYCTWSSRRIVIASASNWFFWTLIPCLRLSSSSNLSLDSWNLKLVKIGDFEIRNLNYQFKLGIWNWEFVKLPVALLQCLLFEQPLLPYVLHTIPNLLAQFQFVWAAISSLPQVWNELRFKLKFLDALNYENHSSYLIPWSWNDTTICEESCVLSKMGEMKNAQGTSVRVSLWACKTNMNCKAWINYSK